MFHDYSLLMLYLAFGLVFIICLSESKSSVDWPSLCGLWDTADLDIECKIFMRQSGRGECPTSE